MQPAAVQVTTVTRSDVAHRVRDAQHGDLRAFEAIVETALPGAYRLAAAILGNEADAADATQNALVAAWRELPRLRDTGAFDAWFHRILVNECRMRVRDRQRRRETPIDPLVDDGGAYPESAGLAALARSEALLSRVEALDMLEAAFEALDPEDRAMVVLHHLEDRPVAEIAASMHMPVGTVKWRLHEARGALQRALEGER